MYCRTSVDFTANDTTMVKIETIILGLLHLTTLHWPLLTSSLSISPLTETKPKPKTTETSTTPLTRLEWQETLIQKSSPLPPTLFPNALSTLQRDGVVRIDGRSFSIDPSLCSNLRQTILEELASGDSRWETTTSASASTSTGNDNDDEVKVYIPGTRLRFTKPIDISFGGTDRRHDLLLPLNNRSKNWLDIRMVLDSVVRKLQPLLDEAVDQMLPRLHGSGDTESNDNDNSSIEIVELASLIARYGSNHQNIHGDYRRYPYLGEDAAEEEPAIITKSRIGKLPPRLVTFVVLQDVPTIEHGATVFVTGTHDAEAHELVYGNGMGIQDANSSQDDDLDDDNDEGKMTMATIATRRSLLLEHSTRHTFDSHDNGVRTASQFRCGDVLIYDASVLHWGGPNRIVGNDRAILYFGVARSGAAQIVSGEVEGEELARLGFKALAPVRLKDVVMGGPSSSKSSK